MHVAEDDDLAWTRELQLLAMLVNQARMDAWSRSDKSQRGPEPRAVGPSWAREGQARSLPARALPVSQLMEELSRPRRG